MKSLFQNSVFCMVALLSVLSVGCDKKEPVPEPQSLVISVDEVTSSELKATVTPSSDSFTWYASAFTKEVYESYSSDSEFIGAVISNIRYMIDSGTPADDLLKKGNGTICVENLEESTDYVVFAFGVDEEFNLLTEMAIKEVRTIADEQFFVVDFSGVTAVAMEAKVTPKDNEMTYVFGVASKEYVESFGSESEYIESHKEFLLESYGSLSKAIVSGETYWGTTTLMPETDYYAIVYGMKASGDVTTPLFKFPFKTEPVTMIDMTFDINMDIEHNVVEYTVTPSSDSDWYFHTFVKKADVGEYSYEELFDKFFKEAYSQYLAPGLGYTREQIMEIVGKCGKIEDVKTLLSETDWIMLIAGITPELLVNTEVSSKEFTTGKAHLDYTIRGEVRDITAVSATVSASFSGPMFYYYGLHTKEYVDGFASDEELLDALDYSGVIPSYEVGLTKTEVGLTPDTDYCAVIIGYNEGPATAPAKIYFKTKKEGDVGNFDMEISVKPFFSASEVAFSPSDGDVLYAYDNITKAKWNEVLASNGNDTDAAIAALYQEKFDKLTGDGWSPEQALNQFSKAGDYVMTFNWLASEAEYVTWAIAVDSEFNPGEKGFYASYSTGKRESTDVAAEIISVKCFQMAELREEFPDASWYQGNNAVVVYEVKPDESAYHWYSTEWYYDITQETDQELFDNAFPYSSGKDQKYGKVIIEWGKEISLYSFAIDVKGNYGPVDRVTIVPDIEESAPASEYPHELLEGLSRSAAPKMQPRKVKAQAVPAVADAMPSHPVFEVEKPDNEYGFNNVVRINK